MFICRQVYLAVSGRNSRINRISYDGSSESALIDNVDMPLSLAVDFESKDYILILLFLVRSYLYKLFF